MEKQDLGYGITLTWLYDHQIAVIETQGDMSRMAVATWADVTVRTLRRWPADKPLFMLQDLSHPNQGVTPYGMQRNKEIVKSLPRHQMGYIAAIFKNPTLVKIAFSLIRRGSGYPANLETTIAGTQATGLAWLESKLEESKGLQIS